MKLPELAIKNYQFALVLLLLLTLLGLVSFFTMPRSEDPQFDLPAAQVVALFPGANPEDVESLVVDPIEGAINELEDIRRIETTIEDGVAVTAVEFYASTDPGYAYDSVVEAVNSVRGGLPDGVLALETIRATPTDVTILQVALRAETASYRALQREAERLEKRLERVPGVKRADTWAYPEPEVRVAVDPERMRTHGIALNQVAQAIQASSQNVPGGNVDLGRRRFNVRTSGDYASLEDIRRTIIDGRNGRLVYLEDLADIRLDYRDETHRARFEGVRCVFVSLLQREGSNIFKVMQGVSPVLDRFKEELPEGITLHTVFDQSEAVDARVNGFFANLLQGILLVGAVILFVLGLRASIIVMLAIPTSILIAIAGVDLSGYGLQQISIVGLVIALGLLVDNAIVVTENARRYLKLGVPGEQAAVRGTGEVGWAIVSATATTVLAFLPMVVIQSNSGDFIRSLPVTVIYALAASLLVALVLTPLLISRFLKTGRGVGAPLERLLARVVEGPYQRALAAALRRPVIVLASAGLVFAGSLALFPIVGVSLFPKADKPQFLINIETPEGTSLDRTDEVTRFVEGVLAGRADIRRYAANVGRGNPRIYYNVFPRRERSNVAQMLVELNDAREARRVIPELKAALSRYPGARFEILEFENGPLVEAPIAIKVIGPELDVLRHLAGEVEQMVQATPGTENVDNPLAMPKTDLHVRVNRDKAGLLGIPLIEVDRTVRAGMAGLPVATYRDAEGKAHDIVVRLPFEGRPSMADVDRISVSSVMGASIPLRHIATVALEAVPKRIDHFNLERAATVTAYVPEGFSELTVTAEVSRKLEGYDWPPGYRYFVGGELEAQQEGFAGLLRALVVALLGILGVLVLQFRSFSQPLIIFAAIPFAVVGAILSLFITGYTFSFTAFIGLTSLVGIVINNSIILVDYANQLMAEGKTAMEAVKEASQTRFIPILLTTLTTIGGLLPLTLTNSSLWSPLGWVIIGGLTVSTGLTLFVVPTAYKLFTRARYAR